MSSWTNLRTAPSYEARPTVTPGAAISLGVVAKTTLANISDDGLLLEVGFETTTAITAASEVADLIITRDGGTPQVIRIFSAGSPQYAPEVAGFQVQGFGNAIGDVVRISFNADFRSSLLVELDVTAAGNGAVRPSVNWHKRVA